MAGGVAVSARVKIFFRTETISSGEGEDLQSFAVSQLMPAGAMLVALEGGRPVGGGKASEGKGDIELVPGNFVEFSADKLALLAMLPGYPCLIRKKQGSGERIIVDLEPLVQISADGWSAKMTLYPPLSGIEQPDSAMILDLLEKSDVRWGIRDKNIAACIAAVKTDGRPQKNQVIARGRLPVNGENARLRIDIMFGEQAGKELGDGRMDFHERRLFIGVDKGQLLATKVAATGGLAGVNIYGHEVPQVAGKDLIIKTGEDIICDEETGEIRAAFAGVLSVVSDTSVRVTSKHVISSDIDFHTGNIDSRDAVDISGSVKPGFKVVTGGDLVIGGSVESSHIISRGNVVIRGGLTGKDAIVEADGDVDIPVIGNGVITCKGTVRIGREAYYTEIRCQQDILCTGQARVLGSELFAGGSITVMEVDTDTSPNSLLAAATLPERYFRHQKLQKEYYLALAAVESWHRRFGGAGGNEDLAELEEELADVKSALVSFNLIPGVGERDRSGGMRYACRQKITVNGAIRAGAVIRIGNTEATLKKTYGEGFFALNGDTGMIEFHSKTKGPRGAVSEKI